MVSKRLKANASNDPMATASDFLSSAAVHLPTQVISIKLDGTNFLAWSAQLLPLFQSYGLMGIVDGSEFCPPQFSNKEHKVQGIIRRSCSSFLVGVCCILILLLIQRTRLGKHIAGM